MSINWVMLSEREKFVRLPGERLLYTSPQRTSLSIKTTNTYPGAQPVSISSGGGTIYLTNQRIVYLPQSPTPALQSFSAPVVHMDDTYVSAPFFGPNAWCAALKPVAGGGLPTQHALYELKLTFKDGGAYDYHTHFERIKERVRQAIEVARASGQMNGNGVESGGGRGGGSLSQINMAAVDLEDLPAYQETDSNHVRVNASSAPSAHAAAMDVPPPDTRGPSGTTVRTDTQPTPNVQDATLSPPSEPPPGYEEAQRESVANEMERISSGLHPGTRQGD